MAAELAVHFEQGRDPRRAVSHLEQAARNALHRSAYPKRSGNSLARSSFIEPCPDGHERLRREARLSLLLAQVLETTKGGPSRRWLAPTRGRASFASALGDERACFRRRGV